MAIEESGNFLDFKPKIKKLNNACNSSQSDKQLSDVASIGFNDSDYFNQCYDEASIDLISKTVK